MLTQVWVLAILVMAVAGGPPTIVLPQGNSWKQLVAYVREGDAQIVKCSADGSQPVTYEWTFNGVSIRKDPAIVTYNSTGHLLIGKDFKEEQEGEYQCIATNKFGTSMTPYLKIILAEYGLFMGMQDQFPENKRVFSSNHYAMVCENVPFSEPPLKISWEMGKMEGTEFKKDKDVQESERHVIDPKGTLHFLWAEPADATNYRCAGTNSITDTTVQNTKIINFVVEQSSAKDRSPIVMFEDPVEVMAGETATLTCIFSYYSVRGAKFKIEWRFGNKVLGEGRTLVIPEVKLPDTEQNQEGEYVCAAKLGALQEVTGKVHLKIYGRPEFTVVSNVAQMPSHTSVPVDSSPNFFCRARSHNAYMQPPVWFVNGKPLIGCPPFTFDCGVPKPDGFSQCVPQSQVCDSSPECSNDADEQDCPVSCGEGQILCNGLCIGKTATCIPTKEDECIYPMFRCTNGKACLPKAQRCDERKQCQDGSDERGCSYGQDTKHNRFIINSDRSVLTLPNVKKVDVMCFQCLVSNDNGTVLGDGCLEVFEKITITTPPNATYYTEPDRVVGVYIDAITDSKYSSSLGYTWYWYRPVKHRDGSMRTERQELPPPGMERYFKLPSSTNMKKNLTITVPDVKQPVDPKNTAMCEMYNLLTENRVFQVNISHKYDSVDVNFTVSGKKLAKPVPEPTIEKAGFNLWFIALILGILILFIILALIICYCYRNRGGTYMLDKKEKKAGNDPEQELKDSGFQDVGRVDDYYDSTRPEETASLTESTKPYESDEDITEEYGGDSDVNKFNEDGSFIGEYNKRNNKSNTKEATV